MSKKPLEPGALVRVVDYTMDSGKGPVSSFEAQFMRMAKGDNALVIPTQPGNTSVFGGRFPNCTLVVPVSCLHRDW